MSDPQDSGILNLLHPDLLTKEDLIDKLQSRCCKVQNLCSMSKERLVGLFRQMVLPLPQRMYRANRRGKMLNSRRTKESKKETQGSRKFESRSNTSLSSRSYSQEGKRHSDLDKIVINNRRKISKNAESKEESVVDEKKQKLDTSTNKKIILKRTSSDSQSSRSSSTHNTDSKKQRTEIKWP